jgi:hypothetical protein
MTSEHNNGVDCLSGVCLSPYSKPLAEAENADDVIACIDVNLHVECIRLLLRVAEMVQGSHF